MTKSNNRKNRRGLAHFAESSEQNVPVPFPSSRRPKVSVALVGKALNQAAQDALELHRRANLPLAVWENGQVVLRAPDSIEPTKPQPKPQPKTPRRRKPS